MRPILLTLMLVLLLTGSGEAGEKIKIIDIQTSGCTASQTWNGKEFPPPTCYQRMREAMARLDEVLRFNHESLLNRKSGEARISLNVGEGAFQQWDRTIRDCVKETP